MSLPNKPAFVYVDLVNPFLSDNALNQAPSESGHYATAAELQVPQIWYPKALKHTGHLFMETDHTRHPKCHHGHQLIASLVYGTIANEVFNVCTNRGVEGWDAFIQMPQNIE